MCSVRVEMLARYLFCLTVLFLNRDCSGNNCISNTTRIFLDNFVLSVNGSDRLSLDSLQELFLTKSISHHPRNTTSCNEYSDEEGRNECLIQHCMSVEDILKVHSIPTEHSLTIEEVNIITPALLYQKTSCEGSRVQQKEVSKAIPPIEQAWGFGFLCVTIINLCSLSGAIVLPCMKKTIYRKVLIFLVALAVGSLAASALLVLIPEALGLMNTEDHEIKDIYIWKTCTVAGGIYLFFLIERLLKVLFKIRQTGEDIHYASVKRKTSASGTRGQFIRTFDAMKSKSELSFASTKTLDVSTISSDDFDTLYKQGQAENNGIPSVSTNDHEIHEKKEVATVAWMIIFGDGLHNFIDGLTIGAAFTDSILAGISICMSVFCEELPHELGDFAILINSGMTVKRALLYNFFSACMCYLGLIVGILLGENTTAHDWVFAIAGGMFLYISLVDMVPEMNFAAESEENQKNIGSVRLFLIQNVGLLTGFGVILIMAVYGGDINFEK